LPKIEWRRPNEISLKKELIGFYESKVDIKKLTSLQGSDNILGGRISQSTYLDNRWFLNAVSMVAAEERQFDLVTLKDDKEIQSFREKGLYVFRFFKAYTPVFVVVDDLIPTEELADGQPIPLFAKCANPNLFWVSLIEKAFAKLHGRYFSLQGGTTDEALEDLLGVSVENCFIDRDMTDVAAFTLAL